MRILLSIFFVLLLVACQSAEQPASVEPVAELSEPSSAQPATEEVQVNSADPLSVVLDAQPDDVKARYQYRHPKETIEFFGIEPGMTVVEGLPGSGWYSKILLPYLGEEGCLIGVNYALDMWPNFSFADEAFLEEVSGWLAGWPAQAKEWGGENSPHIAGFWFGSLPESFENKADVVFFPRVLHNLARFQSDGVANYLDVALADAYAVLKPGGIFGVVQHEARDDMSDEWAYGGNGYLKKQFVIEQAQAAGFELVADSDINANPNDQPGEQDIVWRLPPSLVTSRDNEELKAQYEAVGESNRMTLKFKKPE